MTTLKMLILSAAALGAGGASTLLQQPGCATTAQALRIAGEIDAQSDFWETLAAIANEPGNHAALLQEARDARDEALELSEDQFEARMALCGLFGPGVYRPALLPNEFSSVVTNQYLPLVVGRKLIYEKHVGPDVERIEVETLPGTKDINGFDCAIVRDVVFLNGVLHEDTHDWFAQRNDGSVWYFGEIALNFDQDGELSDVEGSWRYGRDGAQPGTLMLANPQVGDAYRQEYLIGEAEDVARVIATGVSVSVPAGTFHNCIVTQEGSPLEPDASEHKFYAPGIGVVMELDPSSGETLELIQIQ
jgi:hypothetical protein